jgi:hypothetical protein
VGGQWAVKIFGATKWGSALKSAEKNALINAEGAEERRDSQRPFPFTESWPAAKTSSASGAGGPSVSRLPLDAARPLPLQSCWAAKSTN